jgi:hypothetical protein
VLEHAPLFSHLFGLTYEQQLDMDYHVWSLYQDYADAYLRSRGGGD